MMTTKGVRSVGVQEAVAGTVVALVVGGLWLLLVRGRRCHDSEMPFVAGWPVVGNAVSFYSCPVKWAGEMHKVHGDVFRARCVGAEDIEALLSMPERRASMLKAVHDLVGGMLPRESAPEPHSVPFVAHSLHPAKITAYVPVVREAMSSSFRKLPESGTLDLFQLCQELISNVTVRVLLGDNEETAQVRDELIRLFHEADPTLALKTFRGTVASIVEVWTAGERRVYTRVRCLLYPLVDAEIESAIENNANDPEPREAISVLSSFVRSHYERRLDRDADRLRSERTAIANEVFLFFFAAFSNTFAAAAWTMYHVLRDTNGVGTRIKAELLTSAESDDGHERLVELERCVLEVGRLYTPGLALRKLVESPWQIPSTGQLLMKGTTLAVSVYHAMRDPNLFHDPLVFDPRRFEPPRDERANARKLFMPFGAGAHPCPGRRLAMLEIATFVAEALRGMKWTIIGETDEGEGTNIALHHDNHFTRRAINVPRHPTLNPAHADFLWLPKEPLLVQYERVH